MCCGNTKWADPWNQIQQNVSESLWGIFLSLHHVYNVGGDVRACVNITAGIWVRAWVRKCGVRVLVASAVRRCIYLKGSGADPAHKHSSLSQRAWPQPPETTGLSFLLHHTSVYSVHPACHLKHTEPYCNYNWKRMETFRVPGVQTLPPFKLKYRNLHDFSFKGDSRWRWWFWEYILVSALSYWDELWPRSSTDGRV